MKVFQYILVAFAFITALYICLVFVITIITFKNAPPDKKKVSKLNTNRNVPPVATIDRSAQRSR